jgi:hypothetical protein
MGGRISFNEQLEPVGDPRLDVLSPGFSLVGIDFVWLSRRRRKQIFILIPYGGVD